MSVRVQIVQSLTLTREVKCQPNNSSGDAVISSAFVICYNNKEYYSSDLNDSTSGRMGAKKDRLSHEGQGCLEIFDGVGRYPRSLSLSLSFNKRTIHCWPL